MYCFCFRTFISVRSVNKISFKSYIIVLVRKRHNRAPNITFVFVASKSDYRNCPFKGIYTINKVSKSISWNDVSSNSPNKNNLNVSINERTHLLSVKQTCVLDAGGLIDIRPSPVRGVDYYFSADAEAALVWALREVVGRLERDLQKVTARLAEPGEGQKKHQQGVREDAARLRRRRTAVAQGEEKRSTDFEQQNEFRRRV